MSVIAGRKEPVVLEYLQGRRSVKAADMVGPGPDADELKIMLKAATRVPDHGKLCPWYFLTFEGDARAQAGDVIAEIFAQKNPQEAADKVEVERSRFMRAPQVIAVVHRVRRGKHPVWEQIMSTGAACQNLLLAANALGFCAQWLSEWYAYDRDVLERFGLDERDHIAGFIHVGRVAAQPEERERPDIQTLWTRWSLDVSLSKGDAENDREKFDYSKLGFDFTKL